MRVLARRGLSRGGHGEIALEAGVAVATVFAYFRTREELLHGVLDETAGRVRALAERHLSAEVPAPRALLDFAIAFSTFVDEANDVACVLLDWSTAVRDEVWPRYLAFHADMLDRFVATIRRGQLEGSIPGEVDAENAALILIGAAHLVVQMRFARQAPERIERFQLALVRSALGAEVVANVGA